MHDQLCGSPKEHAGPDIFFGSFLPWGFYAVVTLYFYLGGNAPVLRFWSFVPRIGETIVLPELGGNFNKLKVYDVVCEGYDDPSISIYLHHTRSESDGDDQLVSDDETAGY